MTYVGSVSILFVKTLFPVYKLDGKSQRARNEKDQFNTSAGYCDWLNIFLSIDYFCLRSVGKYRHDGQTDSAVENTAETRH